MQGAARREYCGSGIERYRFGDWLGIEEQDARDAILTDCGRSAPLDDSEIDALCGQLNASHDRDASDARKLILG